MTPGEAYAARVAQLGAPASAVEMRFRRIYAGAPLESPRLVGERPFVYYESREALTDVPDGARWETTHMQNLDGGPGLRNQIAILDLPHPHCTEDVDALTGRWAQFLDVPRLVAQLHEALAAWGTKPLRAITWLSRQFPIEGLLGSQHPEEPLGKVRGAVHELMEVSVEHGAEAEAAAWQTLAARGEVWPRETDDSYYPGIWIADAWVGKRIADTPNPFPPLIELQAGGFAVDALAGDEAILWLPVGARLP